MPDKEKPIENRRNGAADTQSRTGRLNATRCKHTKTVRTLGCLKS